MEAPKLRRSKRKRQETKVSKAPNGIILKQEEQPPHPTKSFVAKNSTNFICISSESNPKPRQKQKSKNNWREENVFYAEAYMTPVNNKRGMSATRVFRESQGLHLVDTLSADIEDQRVASARLRENINDLYAEKRELEEDIRGLKKNLKIAGLLESRDNFENLARTLRDEEQDLKGRVESLNMEKERAQADLAIIEKNAEDLLSENQMLKNRISLLELEILDLNGGPSRRGWPKRMGSEWDGLGLNADEDLSEESERGDHYANGGS